MNTPFISLYDAIHAIAPRIQIPNETIDAYIVHPSEEDDFLLTLARAPVRTCFQNSRAAIQLLHLLFSDHIGTKWYDSSEIGLYLQSDPAREEARQILISYANDEKLLRKNFSDDQRAPSRFTDTQTKVKFMPLPKRPRSMEIRLKQDELIALLDGALIAHNLQAGVTAENKTEQMARKTESTESSESPTAPYTEPTLEKRVQPEESQHLPAPSSLPSHVHLIADESFPFRGPLRQTIIDLINSSTRPIDPYGIWAQLVKRAIKDPPPPLLGITTKKKKNTDKNKRIPASMSALNI
ncbi:hypothetical protein G5S34_04370 [Herbaspirillum frisingense]|uniref:hypothetical protein n=1 Tax=Herbaspirillum frisingense TaxID=92645 RepID=UPI001602886E|nr:hypothetical protein [Herbaspirillum frisingense]QNB06082.1 hypothetical protein G5S34_04370 [Herbaspirillum frisingense]